MNIGKTRLNIYVIAENIIQYECNYCKKISPFDKILLKRPYCTRCGRIFKNRAKIIRRSKDEIIGTL